MTNQEPESTSKLDARCKPQRKIEILQAVMKLLEEGEKVTTAGLAKRLQISEAALYRHYKGKAAIFEALASYVEEYLMLPINKLMEEEDAVAARLERLLYYHLRFLEEHPGLCRLFLVEGVVHETEDIRERMVLIVRKYTAQIKQIIRLGQASGEFTTQVSVAVAAQLFVGILQFQALVYVMSRFQNLPSKDGAQLWMLFQRAVQLPAEG